MLHFHSPWLLLPTESAGSGCGGVAATTRGQPQLHPTVSSQKVMSGHAWPWGSGSRCLRSESSSPNLSACSGECHRDAPCSLHSLERMRSRRDAQGPCLVTIDSPQCTSCSWTSCPRASSAVTAGMPSPVLPGNWKGIKSFPNGLSAALPEVPFLAQEGGAIFSYPSFPPVLARSAVKDSCSPPKIWQRFPQGPDRTERCFSGCFSLLFLLAL